MIVGSWLLLGISVAVVGYAYAGYPLLLWLIRAVRSRQKHRPQCHEWPKITISIPVYNEEASIRGALEGIVGLDYPADRRQVLVISDASVDRTDDIVREFADRGVELIRQSRRLGKTAAENAARERIRGDIVVNTDASIRVARDALKPLVATFSDPTVGVASGRDVSVARVGDDANLAESGYVGYEMWVRDLETEVDGIVGASGCFYASRRDVHMQYLPDSLSRDFAAPLIAREQGLRSVAVRDAVCYVPRAASLHREYRRKVRTMARGLETLFFKRRLLNPFRHGLFAWMLVSHKLVRWLVPWALLVGALGVAILALTETWARALLAASLLAGTLPLLGWFWPGRKVPRLLAVSAYVLLGTVAAVHAWINLLRGRSSPIWEPTRGEGPEASLPEPNRGERSAQLPQR